MLEMLCTLKGTATYSPSRAHETPKLDKETADAYEKRTWLEKGHYDDQGRLYIPAMAFKQSLDTAAKLLGHQIPGKGKNTYTKHFLSGVMCANNLDTGIPKDKCDCQRIYANSDGVRGSGKRVWRLFPTIPSWQGTLRFVVIDATVTEDVFLETLEAAGNFVGVGRFRPERGGTNGRFEITKSEARIVGLGRRAA